MSIALQAIAQQTRDMLSPPVGEAPGAPGSFSTMLEASISKVQGLESQAAEAVQGLMAGTGVDVHTALIATQKADTAFEMALSFRNKAVAAYQQLMSTQF